MLTGKVIVSDIISIMELAHLGTYAHLEPQGPALWSNHAPGSLVDVAFWCYGTAGNFVDPQSFAYTLEVMDKDNAMVGKDSGGLKIFPNGGDTRELRTTVAIETNQLYIARAVAYAIDSSTGNYVTFAQRMIQFRGT